MKKRLRKFFFSVLFILNLHASSSPIPTNHFRYLNRRRRKSSRDLRRVAPSTEARVGARIRKSVHDI